MERLIKAFVYIASYPNHVYYAICSLLFGLYVGMFDPFADSRNYVFQTYATTAPNWVWMAFISGNAIIHLIGYYFKYHAVRFIAMLMQVWFWFTIFFMLFVDNSQPVALPLYGFIAAMHIIELLTFDKVR